MCGSTPPPPDYKPMQEASDRAATLANEQAQAQLAFSQRMYDEQAPLNRQVQEQQMSAQTQQMEQGAEFHEFWQDNYKGLEVDLAKDAANYNTEAHRETLANTAAADAGLAFSQTSAANDRQMRSMGVNPNSGRFQGAKRSNAVSQALGRGGAMNRTRQFAEQEGQRRMAQAVGLGRGHNSTSLSAFGGASGAGSQAAGVGGMAGAAMLGGMQGAGGLMMQGANAQISGLGNVLNSQTSLYQTGMEGQAALTGALIGGATSMIPSDRRLKENIEIIGIDENTLLTLYAFNYKNGNTRYQGVMADEVVEAYPDAVVTDNNGFMSVNYAAIGIEFKELG